MPRKDTSLEIAFEKELKSLGATYEKQKNLWNICIADFFLPNKNLAVFVDGDYWHNLPKTKAKDERQMKELEHKPIKTVRVLGSTLLRHLADGTIESYLKELLTPSIK